jgi:hypothetical protein
LTALVQSPTMPTVALRIFITYRREDASGHAGRLYDALAFRFGAENVFMDVDTIDPGRDFVEAIEEAVRQCDVLVALIGRSWLTARDPAGGRRLDNPADFVRLELERALETGVVVIPASVQGVPALDERELPPSLQPLARRQAIELRDAAWHDDVNRLIRQLEKLAAEAKEPVPAAADVAPAKPPRHRRRLLLLALVVAAIIAAVAAAAVLSTSGGGKPSTDSVPQRGLLQTIPAVTRPTCHSITYGEKSAQASLECAGVKLDVIYNVFAQAATLDGWYVQQRQAANPPAGSGGCTPSAFLGEGRYSGGTYLCFLDSGRPTLVWTDTKNRVGAVANIYEGRGPAAAASLLRQWRCCLRKS